MKTIITLFILCVPFSLSAYEFKWNTYKFNVPENITFLEYQVMRNVCDMETYWCKLAKLNIILVNRGYAPIY